ncbi:MAG: DUF3370 domain-containing protein [Merismopedia sp. SIO2A8]|nr:DUF3370 domain-containing protein [Merismopedia sp. SIO2A8]
MLTFLSLLSVFQTPAPLPPIPSSEPIATPVTVPATAVNISNLHSPIEHPSGSIHLPVQSTYNPLVLASRPVTQPRSVRPLPGQLDTVPVFNSNSPEVIQQEGVLLSTFPPETMAEPTAHLNYAFDGRFDIFAHHVARGLTSDDIRTMYMGVIVHNPNASSVTLNISQAATYLSQEAPFLDLPAYVANPLGTVFAGPGSRVMNDILRGIRQPHWPTTITIPPQHTHLLMNLPIPLRRLEVPVNGTLPSGRLLLPPLPEPEVDETMASASLNSGLLPNTQDTRNDNRPLPTNGRTALVRLYSSGPVYVASLAMYAPMASEVHERVPTLREWANILTQKGLAGPRDYPPTPPDAEHFSRFFYGRVAGVAQGSQWVATLTDSAQSNALTIPASGQRFSYALSTLDHNTFGTGQIQSGPMVSRYPDTAYRAHGNYGVHYNLALPLHNNTNQPQDVVVAFETPIQDEDQEDALTFLEPPEDRIFFRGTVLVRYMDSWNIPQARYFHLVQRRGQEGEPLVRLRMQPGDRRPVKVEFLYPPDATPPQVLTVETLPKK